MKDKNSVIKKLRETGFKLTPQRLAIIEILIGNTTHPSADIIYQKLRKKYSMVSYSTVYNTLNVLKKIGEVMELTINENKINYDSNTDPHHHLLCEKCGQIKDIFQKIDFKMKLINSHRVKKYQIYFYGICSDCLKNKKDYGG
ncbi:MAG: Fur family transcriptional regulator [Candidatus Aminicenantia bacterium]